MTENKRIALNICATYGRSVYAVFCGMLTCRWTLRALGHVDYGLMGVIGGLVAFLTFLNSLISSSIIRYYAVSVGEAQRDGNYYAGLEKCRQWFNTAFALHTVLPIFIIIVGYPVGVWAITEYLTIPEDRVSDCIVCFRYVCLSCLIGMISVPFNAMYIAKQYIAELTIYGVVASTLNLIYMYYAGNNPGEWLVGIMAWSCLLSVATQLLIIIRAALIFPECRLRLGYLWSANRFRELMAYVSWKFFGNLGCLVRTEGIAVLVNKLYGPVYNASSALANTIGQHTDSLAAAMTGAFSPAIMNRAGRHDYTGVTIMMYRMCRIGGILSLLFILPLSVEIDDILIIWLGDPPILVSSVTKIVLATIVVDELGKGVGIAVCAYGKIASYHALIGVLNILSLPLAWFVSYSLNGGFISIFFVLLFVRVFGMIWSIKIAGHTVDVSVIEWIKQVLLPIVCVITIPTLLGIVINIMLRDSIIWLRIVAVVFVVLSSFLVMSWVCALQSEEKERVMAYVHKGLANIGYRR